MDGIGLILLFDEVGALALEGMRDRGRRNLETQPEKGRPSDETGKAEASDECSPRSGAGAHLDLGGLGNGSGNVQAGSPGSERGQTIPFKLG